MTSPSRRRHGLDAAARGTGPLSLVAALLLSAQAAAAPVTLANGQSTVGDVSISQEGNKTRVVQRSPRAILTWSSFDIAANEAVVFNQPGADAVALNRIVSQTPTSIQGSLTANGRVFLANPSGIVFGPGAQVNVGGLVATTANVTDQDFMAGDFEFRLPGAGGAIVNQGSISAAPGGRVALLGRTVQNLGTITAEGGAVVLATGDLFLIDLFGDGLINVASAIQGPVQGPPLSSSILQVGAVNVGSGVLFVRRADAAQLTGTLNGAPIEQAAQTAVPLIGGGLAFVGESSQPVQYGAPTWLDLPDDPLSPGEIGGQEGGVFDVTPVYSVSIEPGSVTTTIGEDSVAGASGQAQGPTSPLSQFNRLTSFARLWTWDADAGVTASVEYRSPAPAPHSSLASVQPGAVTLAQAPVRPDDPGWHEPAATRGAATPAGKRYCTVKEVRSARTATNCRGG